MGYFIADGTYTKIGKSKNPLSRIRGLQTSNGNTLKFVCIFDCKDSWEKKLHKRFNQFKTNSSNEWFDLRNSNYESTLTSIDDVIIKDLSLAKFKANQLNNELFRGSVHTTEARNVVFDQHYNLKKKPDRKTLQQNLRDKRLNLIHDIEEHLNINKNKRLSYDKYVIKYGFTKSEISFYLRGVRLSKRIFEHNSRL